MRPVIALLRALVVLVAVIVHASPVHADVVEGPLDRTTPRRAVASFLEAAQAGDDKRAAQVLDLKQIPPSQRAERGPELARMLHEVLERSVVLEPAQLSDDPAGRPEDGPNAERVTAVRLRGSDVPVMLARGVAGGDAGWVFSASTVARVPKLYEELGPGWLETRVPGALRPRLWGLEAWQWLGLLVAFVVGIVVGRVIAWAAWRLGTRIASSTHAAWDKELMSRLRPPGRVLFALLVFRALVETLGLSAVATVVVSNAVGSVTIVVSAWVIIRVIAVLSNLIERRAVETAKGDAGEIDPTRELRSRGITTQVRVLRRVLNIAIGIVAAALVLLQFEVVRSVGVSLLASASIAGVVLGFAAQRTIGSLIAGIQLSATQPIRIGDVVVVEKEWGVIEEITLTYVVVKIWDERRLVVPMTRFLEQPFENWTKVEGQLHGTVFLQVDWALPLGLLREELARLVEGHPKWDGRTRKVHVTESRERTLEVRVLVSAADASSLWDLRTDLREKLVAWLVGLEGGRYLPKVRVDEPAARGRELAAELADDAP